MLAHALKSSDELVHLKHKCLSYRVHFTLGIYSLILPNYVHFSLHIYLLFVVLKIQDTGDQPYLGKCMFSYKPINRSSVSHLTSKHLSEDFSTSIKQHRYSLDQLVQSKMHPSVDYNNVCVPQDDDLKSNKPKNENITLLSSTHAVSVMTTFFLLFLIHSIHLLSNFFVTI
ncbi:unnamed protein product [Trichobilharzia regenti]|nr:unnamed protein product [Trichobilharzia regenti]